LEKLSSKYLQSKIDNERIEAGINVKLAQFSRYCLEGWLRIEGKADLLKVLSIIQGKGMNKSYEAVKFICKVEIIIKIEDEEIRVVLLLNSAHESLFRSGSWKL